jgi:hypothetical protein
LSGPLFVLDLDVTVDGTGAPLLHAVGDHPAPVSIRIRPAGELVAISADGADAGWFAPAEVLPRLLDLIQVRAVRARPDLAHLRGAVVRAAGRRILLAGAPAAGITSLCAVLVRRAGVTLESDGYLRVDEHGLTPVLASRAVDDARIDTAVWVEANHGGQDRLTASSKLEMVQRLTSRISAAEDGSRGWIGLLCATVDRARTHTLILGDASSAAGLLPVDI